MRNFLFVTVCMSLVFPFPALGQGKKVKGKAAQAALRKKADKLKMPVVELSTSMGKIRIALEDKKAPKTVANFLEYVRSGHYKNTIFHRVISSFMIQGGGFDTQMNEKSTRPPIQNEADNGLSNQRGTVAMARTPNPHSASAQFFINVVDNANLNHREKSANGWGYCVFGKVLKGMDVVDKIRAVPTGNKGRYQNVPLTPVLIKDAKILP